MRRDKPFWESKKALSTVVAALTLIALAALSAPAAAFWAVGIIWGGHQLACGGQETAAEWRGTAIPQAPAPLPRRVDANGQPLAPE